MNPCPFQRGLWNPLPITRARAKHVNSLLVEFDFCVDENFILPKSMYLCMVRVADNTSIGGRELQQELIPNINGCVRVAPQRGQTMFKINPRSNSFKLSSIFQFLCVALRNSTSPVCCAPKIIVTEILMWSVVPWKLVDCKPLVVGGFVSQVCGFANIHWVEELLHWQQGNIRRVREHLAMYHPYTIESLRISGNPISLR